MAQDVEIRRILSIIRESQEPKISSLPITQDTPQFSDVCKSQEDAVTQTIGANIEFDDKSALMFYPENKDLVLSGKIPSLNLTFQFRFNDPSGEGCYIWANALQFTDTNSRTLGKIRDAFVNWKTNLIQDGDLLNRLYKVAMRD